MPDIDSALMKQVFDISQREWKADIYHHCKADDLGRCLEIAKGIHHPKRLFARFPALKALSSDIPADTLSNREYVLTNAPALLTDTKIRHNPKPKDERD